MPVNVPKIDSRTYDELVDQVETQASTFTGGAWQPGEKDQGAALIRIFARLAEIVGERINRIPEKSFLAFLDLVGTRLNPPRPARVPLTFELNRGATGETVVPAATRVASTSLPGEEDEPPVFETEDQLVVTSAPLVAAFVREPERDLYRDVTAAATAGEAPFAAFRGEKPIEHLLYVGNQEILELEDRKDVVLRIAPAGSWIGKLEWAFWSETGWQAAHAAVIAPEGAAALEVTLPDVPGIPVSALAAHTESWLRARLLPDVPLGDPAARPAIASLGLEIRFPGDAVLPDLAFNSGGIVDLSRDFLPFGDQPRLGDYFCVASDTAFSRAGATITLDLGLSHPAAGGDERAARPSADLELRWEYPDAGTGGWREIEGLADGTGRLADDGAVTFPCPPRVAAVETFGSARRAVRVRIARGNYGTPTRYEMIGRYEPLAGDDPGQGYEVVHATYRPPSVRALGLHYGVSSKTAARPTRILSENDFVVQELLDEPTADAPFIPFTPSADREPALYLGFFSDGVAAEPGFANRWTPLYFEVTEPPFDPAREDTAGRDAEIVWEYWNGDRWRNLGARDQTLRLTRPGMVSFLGPADWRASHQFGRRAFWLRARRESAGAPSPELRRVLTNTVWASQYRTFENETLGSGSGQPGQLFHATWTPVLPGQQLEVGEPEPPSAPEREALADAEGDDAIRTGETAGEVWVRWHEVPDFHDSGPRDRHYTLEPLSGEIRFGDGRRGLIPPPGKGNLRLAAYRIGGGLAGDRPAGTVSQLYVPVPGIAAVVNHQPARGGAGAETLEQARIRGPKALRHRGRAVAEADFEDLAFQLSTTVARARCLGARGSGQAGRITLIVVPHGDDPRPVPNVGLLDRLRDELRERMAPTVELLVKGPDWITVTVTAEIVPAVPAAADQLRAVVLARLAEFLHPLRGGPEGGGWAFGRRPSRGELIAVVEEVPGVDHVRWLELTAAGDGDDGAEDGGAGEGFLVCSGAHRIIPITATGEETAS